MNSKQAIEGIGLTMCKCSAVTDGHQLLDVLGIMGCGFVRGFGPEVDQHPGRRVKETGSIIAPVRCRHALLGRDLLSKAKLRIAGVTFLSESRTVGINQAADSNGTGWDELADGQLNLVRQLYDELRPTYGWIDASSESPLPQMIESADDIAFLFWVNLFGPQIVTDLGRSFLSDCPNTSVEYMSDGGAIVVGSQSFSEWVRVPQTDALAHFARKVPRLELYRT